MIGQFFNGSAHTARAAVDATAVAFEDDLRSNEEGDFKTCGSGGLGGPVYVEDCHEYKQITQDFVSHAD